MAISERAYSRAEEWADRGIHYLSLVLAVVGVAFLIVLTAWYREGRVLLAIGVYSVGLLTLLVASTLANHRLGEEPAAWRERFDHAAIFLMIAGTYSPFGLVVLPTGWGIGLLGFVWLVAAVGAGLKLAGRLGYGASIALHLLVGWSILPALSALWEELPALPLALLVAGGVIYTLGIAAFMAHRMKFHTAVWHAMVLVAAGCHYASVLTGVVLATPVG